MRIGKRYYQYRDLAESQGCYLSCDQSKDMYVLVHMNGTRYMLPTLTRVKLALDTMDSNGNCNWRGL